METNDGGQVDDGILTLCHQLHRAGISYVPFDEAKSPVGHVDEEALPAGGE